MSFQPRRHRAVVASLAAGLLLAIAVPAAPAIGITLPGCRVRNVDRATGFTSLQAAVSDAATVSGDHLTVKGLCDGDTVIATDLTIRGIRPPGSITASLYGTGSGSVITIATGARVSIASLRYGAASFSVRQRSQSATAPSASRSGRGCASNHRVSA